MHKSFLQSNQCQSHSFGCCLRVFLCSVCHLFLFKWGDYTIKYLILLLIPWLRIITQMQCFADDGILMFREGISQMCMGSEIAHSQTQ